MIEESTQETLYLMSIPDMVESIVNAMSEPVETCATELDW
jgi:PHD/YefM family antitoxin component YafN of YafNO toxin-antitoxin module